MIMEKETIIKIKKRANPYVQIDKECINNNRLSWKAKGILAYLLSKPNDWQVYITDLGNQSKDGIKSVRSGVKELIDYGYMIRGKKRGNKGRFNGWEYIVYEQPKGQKGISAMTDMPKTEHGKTERGKRHTTNKERTNIDITNKEREEKKLSPSEEMKLFLEDRKYIDKIADIIIKKSGASPDMVVREILSFRSYWAEENKSGTKQRWELQPTFQLKKRLGTWFRNVDKFNQNKKKQIII